MNSFSISDLPIINGENVRLRPISSRDTDLIVAWRNDPEVYRHFIYRGPFTPEIHENWLKTKVATGEVVQYIIENKAERRPIGSVYLRDIDPRHESAEYGIFIGDAEYHGKGYGTETARLFTRFGLDVLGLHRISLRVLADNPGARRSYEKAGFVTEGIARQMVKLDGSFKDVVFMAILSEEAEA